MMRTLHTLLYPGELCVVVVHVQDPKWVLFCTFYAFRKSLEKRTIGKKWEEEGVYESGVYTHGLCVHP